LSISPTLVRQRRRPGTFDNSADEPLLDQLVRRHVVSTQCRLAAKEIDMAKAKKAVPEGHHTVTPQLTLDNAAATIDWYKKALGAEEVSRVAGPDGKIMHAEIRIGDSLIMLNDAMGGGKGPKALGGSPASLWLYVEDCDALFNRAVAAGAQVRPGPMGQLTDQFWGDRSGTFTDPEGYQWTIATRKEDLGPQEMKERMDAFMKSVPA
jgi:PhnB protein